MSTPERLSAFHDHRRASRADHETGQWHVAIFDPKTLMGLDAPVTPATIAPPGFPDLVADDRGEILLGSMEHEFEESLTADAAGIRGTERILDALRDRQVDRIGDRLAGLVNNMIEPIRTVTLAHFYDGDSHEVIAGAFGLSVETVEFLLQAALSHIDTAMPTLTAAPNLLAPEGTVAESRRLL